EKRPFSEEGKARRQARRAQRRRERKARRKGVELSSELIESDVTEDDGMKLLEKIANLRTSTKAGAVGALPLLLMLLPFAEDAEALIQQACQSENGALPFLVGGAVVWVTTYVTARRSKTPATP